MKLLQFRRFVLFCCSTSTTSAAFVATELVCSCRLGGAAESRNQIGADEQRSDWPRETNKLSRSVWSFANFCLGLEAHKLASILQSGCRCWIAPTAMKMKINSPSFQPIDRSAICPQTTTMMMINFAQREAAWPRVTVATRDCQLSIATVRANLNSIVLAAERSIGWASLVVVVVVVVVADIEAQQVKAAESRQFDNQVTVFFGFFNSQLLAQSARNQTFQIPRAELGDWPMSKHSTDLADESKPTTRNGHADGR